jgi:hypothetical protein
VQTFGEIGAGLSGCTRLRSTTVWLPHGPSFAGVVIVGSVEPATA